MAISNIDRSRNNNNFKISNKNSEMAAVNDFTNRINEGWEKIRKNAISKLETYLNTGNSNVMFTKKEYMEYYT